MNPIFLTALLSFSAPLAPLTASTTAEPQETATAPTLEMRLERLVERIEDARASEHVAGLALAVVRGDEVVLTHGFGMADLESERPVTPETIFGIGSTTKAFTSTLVGMLVDDHALDWDDPVSEYLPFFELDTGASGERVTLRDLLCHRSGFTRMTPLVMKSDVPRETILKTAAQAEPWAPFRKEFHYSNIMFLAAGVTAGVVADSSWDELVAERIFEPLGMTSSSTTFAGGQASPELASGYLWDDEKAEYEPKSMSNADGIGPAGSINSNVIDMAQWLRFQLAGGEFDGERLISEESFDATHSPQMQIGGNMSYGLGWMVHEWSGHELVEHGGNIGGFAAQVAILPEEQLGYVLLTNASITSLQSGSIPIVFETLLGEWESGEASADGVEIDYDEYVGNYIANFAAFDEAEFVVQVADGKLAIDVPGQTLYALKNPTDEGRWVFALTDAIEISFERDDAGQLTGLTMYQGGFAFECPREGVEVAPVIPLADLQRYLGEYATDDGKMTGRLLIQNNRLAIDVPGQMTFELHPPDADERWAFRVKSDIAVAFSESDAGQIEALTMYEPDGSRVFNRLTTDEDAAVQPPTLDELMALRDTEARSEALKAAGSMRLVGTVRFANAGLEGAYEMLSDSGDRYSERLDFGPFGVVCSTIDGGRGWSENPMTGINALDGPELRNMMLAHAAIQFGDWRDNYDSVSVLDTADEDGRRVVRVRLKPENSPGKTMYVDAETGDVIRTDGVAISDLINIPTTTRFEDFRTVDGMRIPFVTIAENDWSGRVIVTIEKAETGVEIDATRFEPGEAIYD